MSKITQADVEYIAGLAQLELDAAARERITRELGQILAYVEKLDELDTAGVEPMMHTGAFTNVFREDVVEPSLDRDTALSNAPEADGEYFVVPRILEGTE